MNDITIYDKAKYHYEGQFPSDVYREQAYVHMGMFLGWLVNRNFLDTIFSIDFKKEIDQFRAKIISCAELMRLVGGTLASDMLNQEGNKFAQDYKRPTKDQRPEDVFYHFSL